MKIFIIKLFIFLVFLLIILNECKLKNEEDKEKELLVQQLLNNNSNNTNCVNYNLSLKPTFTELQEKGVFNNCIQCHNALKFDGNLNLLDYNQTVSRIEPNDPQNSLLYIKVTTGTMKNYSNNCINDAIKKWIEAGATN